MLIKLDGFFRGKGIIGMLEAKHYKNADIVTP